MSQNTTTRLKFVLLGDPSTGKKTLFREFASGSVGSKNNAIKRIEGIDVHLYNFPISVFPIQMLFRDADAVFFLFDLTNRESFENITLKWIPLFDANVNLMKSHSSYMILGTKADLPERKVTFKEACELTKLLGVPYTELPSRDDPIHEMVELLLGLGVAQNNDDNSIIYLYDQQPDRENQEEGRCC